MCGIAGAAFKPGLFNRGQLNNRLIRAARALFHRGPDDCGTYIDEINEIGLAHTRLSIIDISESGHQPMFTENKDICIVFNGEIYNFEELRKELLALGYVFNGLSDTEVLLKMYAEYGINFLDRLNGIFALSIFDKLTQTMYLARDHFGVKPLYVCTDNEGVYFGSEIKAINCLNSGIKTIDISSICNYLQYLWCPGSGTPFNEIKKLGPGEFMAIKHGEIIEVTKWYELPIFRSGQHLRLENNLKLDNIILEVKNKLRNAVHTQMLSDVPVGAFLSGGVDSSAIVLYAKEINPSIDCFSIEVEGGLETGVIDDIPYAKHVAKYLNVPLHIVTLKSSDIVNKLEFMVSQLEEPIADPAALNVYLISQFARAQGIKVLLSGAGGDDIFSGYRRHLALKLHGAMQILPKRIYVEMHKLVKHLDSGDLLSRRFNKFLSIYQGYQDNNFSNYFKWENSLNISDFFSNEFQLSISKNLSNDVIQNFADSIPKSASRLNKMLAIEQRFFLGDHNLIYTDKMSMAAGVEVRVPFLDSELVNLAASIPDKYKQKYFSGKWILKKSLEGSLPNDILYRKKSGFGLPIRKWVLVDLHGIIEEYLSEYSLKSRGVFNSSKVRALIDDNRSGRVDGAYTIFSLLCLEIWFRQNQYSQV